MKLKERVLVLVVLIIGVLSSIGFIFELEGSSNKVYLHSIVDVNNDSIESLNNKIDSINKENISIINEYNDCLKSIGTDTDFFSCGNKPQVKIFKKLNKIDIKNLYFI